MDIKTLTTFFMWCTIINGGMLVLTSVLCTFAAGWVYRVHSKWFPMSRETFNVVIYAFIGLFKISFIVLNLVPFLVLLIMGG